MCVLGGALRVCAKLNKPMRLCHAPLAEGKMTSPASR